MMSFQNYILKNRFLSFLFLVVFFALPFERIPTIEAFGFTVKISYILVLIFFTAILLSGKAVDIFRAKELSTSDKSLILFWVTSLISLLWAPNLKRGFIIFSLWTFVFLVYLIFSRLLINKEIRRRAEDIIIFTSVLVCIFGVYQFLGDSFGLSAHFTQILPQYSKVIFDFPRIQSVGLEPLYFANFLLVPAFLVAKRYLTEKGFFNRYFFMLSLIFINIILTVARGAYIALAFSGFLFFIYLICEKGYKERLKKSIGLISIFVISALISAAAIIFINGKKAASNFTTHTVVSVVSTDQRDYSQLDRFDTYKLALDYTKKNPLFGNGLGSFGVYATPDFKKNQGVYQTVNNEYLEILTETGAVGILFFLLFIIFYGLEVFKNFRRRNIASRISTMALGLGLFAILIQYNFFSTLYIIYIWVFLALLKGEINSEEA